MKKLTHVDEQGRAAMVDVGGKDVTDRLAVARGSVVMKRETLDLIMAGNLKKGDVLAVARIAGIMAAKRTSEIIPLCHPLQLTHIDVSFIFDEDVPAVQIEGSARTSGQTGVEMEALTAVTSAALTIYDMAKAVDREMQISNVRLVEKRGGKSGTFTAE